MPMPSLFAVKSAPSSSPEDDDADDYADDAAPLDELMEEAELGAGPFDAYAETVFSDADTPTKADALRQAVMTLIEEHMGGMGKMGGPGGMGGR